MFVFLEHRAESDRCSWLGAWMKENCTVLLAGVSEQVDAAVCQDVNMLIQRLPLHAQRLIHHVTTRPPRLSFALAMILTIDARGFQRTHLLRGMGSSINASKDISMQVTDLALTCGSEPVVGAVCTAVNGFARTGRAHDAGSDREDRSYDVCYVGDTR